MEAIKTFLHALVDSPHYSYGWVVVAVLAAIPAIVSVNLIQHELSKFFGENNKNKGMIKTLSINFAVLLVSISAISYAFYLYFWK